MRRLIWDFAGRTYHIVGNLMSWLNHDLNQYSKLLGRTKIFKIWKYEVKLLYDQRSEKQSHGSDCVDLMLEYNKCRFHEAPNFVKMVGYMYTTFGLLMLSVNCLFVPTLSSKTSSYLYCSQKVGDIRIAKIITFTKQIS